VNVLRKAGIHVRVENWGGKMHMKAAVSDHRNVIIGSMNWSKAGNHTNDENTMSVSNNPSLAGEMADYFETLWRSLDGYYSSTKGVNIRDPRAESLESINSCFDGLDNDYDGTVDGEDSGCKPATI